MVNPLAAWWKRQPRQVQILLGIGVPLTALAAIISSRRNKTTVVAKPGPAADVSGPGGTLFPDIEGADAGTGGYNELASQLSRLEDLYGTFPSGGGSLAAPPSTPIPPPAPVPTAPIGWVGTAPVPPKQVSTLTTAALMLRCDDAAIVELYRRRISVNGWPANRTDCAKKYAAYVLGQSPEAQKYLLAIK